MISDATKVPDNDKTGCAWKVMKRFAMKPDIEREHWFVAYTEKEQALVKALVNAQRQTGDDKGNLDPVPNPLHEDN